MRSYADQRDPKRSAIGFVAVVALHVLLIWALLDGLGHRMIDVIKGPLVAKIIPQVKPPEQKTPPPPPPTLAPPPPPFIPPPIVNVEAPPSTNTITTVTTAPPPVVPAFKPAPPAAVPDQDVTAGSFLGRAPTYPDDLIDDGVEGSASIECTFNANGTTQDCTIVKVTGSSEFGSAALEFAKTHAVQPAIRGGKPITERVVVPFKFVLKD